MKAFNPQNSIKFGYEIADLYTNEEYSSKSKYRLRNISKISCGKVDDIDIVSSIEFGEISEHFITIGNSIQSNTAYFSVISGPENNSLTIGTFSYDYESETFKVGEQFSSHVLYSAKNIIYVVFGFKIKNQNCHLYFNFLYSGCTLNYFTFKNLVVVRQLESENIITDDFCGTPSEKVLSYKTDFYTMFIQYSTNKLGLDLSEILCVIESNKKLCEYENMEIIEKLYDHSFGDKKFYNFSLNIGKMINGKGDSLLEKIDNIASLEGKNTLELFGKVCEYATLRYIFAGLSDNYKFSKKHLYANNYKNFLYKLENSDFSIMVPTFTQASDNEDFSEYNKYFKSCNCKKMIY